MFSVITALWGSEFTRFYLGCVLPHTMKWLPSDAGIVVGTIPEFEREINSAVQSNPAVRVIVCSAEGLTEKTASSNRYIVASSIERAIIAEELKSGRNRFVLQTPDAIISLSMIESIRSAIAFEKKVITVPGLRVCKEEYAIAYGSPQIYSDDDNLEQSLTCLHPITKSLAISGGYKARDNRHPSILHVIERDKVFCSAYHRHPLFFEVPPGISLSHESGTQDEKFLQTLGWPDKDYVHLEHSSEGFVLEFSSISQANRAHYCGPFSKKSIEAFASKSCTDQHLLFSKKPYTWSTRKSDYLDNPFRILDAPGRRQSRAIRPPEPMSLTVWIPAFNAEATIARAIESAINQRHVQEVVVIDDCSTDKTFEICQRYSGEKFRYVRHENKSENWMRAAYDTFKTFRGTHSVGLSADDYLLGGFSDVVSLHGNAPAVFCGYIAANSRKPLLKNIVSVTDFTCQLEPEEVREILLDKSTKQKETGIASAIRHDCLEWLCNLEHWKCGPWADSVGYAAVAAKFGATYIDKVLSYFEQSEDGYGERERNGPNASLYAQEAVKFLVDSGLDYDVVVAILTKRGIQVCL